MQPPADRAKNLGRDDFANLVQAVRVALGEAGSAPGLTVEEVAATLRVSPDKIRAWLATGELVGTNTSATLAGRPRWVIAPESLAAFRAKRTSAPLPKQPTRRRRSSGEVDFFPD